MKNLKIEYLRGIEDGILLMEHYLYLKLRKNPENREHILKHVSEIAKEILSRIYEEKIAIIKQELILLD